MPDLCLSCGLNDMKEAVKGGLGGTELPCVWVLMGREYDVLKEHGTGGG